MIERLSKGESLRLYYDSTCILSSGKSWLHPLLDLTREISSLSVDANRLFLIDTITGKAAAFLVVRLGIKRLYAGIMSDLASEVLDRAGAEYSSNIRVPRIDCQTEEILASVFDPEVAYELILGRAEQAKKRALESGSTNSLGTGTGNG